MTVNGVSSQLKTQKGRTKRYATQVTVNACVSLVEDKLVLLYGNYITSIQVNCNESRVSVKCWYLIAITLSVRLSVIRDFFVMRKIRYFPSLTIYLFTKSKENGLQQSSISVLVMSFYLSVYLDVSINTLLVTRY